MKTPKELAALDGSSRQKYVVSNLNVFMDRACLEGKITKNGGKFEVTPMQASDWDAIKEFLEDHHWHALLKYDQVAEKYKITVTPDQDRLQK